MDCSVLRTPIIHPTIRISQDYNSILCSDWGGFKGLLSTYEQAHMDSYLFTLVSVYCKSEEED